MLYPNYKAVEETAQFKLESVLYFLLGSSEEDFGHDLDTVISALGDNLYMLAKLAIDLER